MAEVILASTQDLTSANVLQATLSQIRGLVDSQIILDEHRNVSEIHIVASSARNPKRIVRDVETLLLVKHGVKVDYRKISLVQVDENPLAQGHALRLIIQNVINEDFGGAKRIRVEIQGLGRYLVGAAEVGPDNPSPLYAAARATIHSLRPLIKHHADVQLAEAQVLQLSSEQLVVVMLNCLVENREERWVGSCFLGPRPAESAVRATLDALNRRIFYLM